MNFVEFTRIDLNLLEFAIFEKRVTDGRTKPLIELLFPTNSNNNMLRTLFVPFGPLIASPWPAFAFL